MHFEISLSQQVLVSARVLVRYVLQCCIVRCATSFCAVSRRVLSCPVVPCRRNVQTQPVLGADGRATGQMQRGAALRSEKGAVRLRGGRRPASSPRGRPAGSRTCPGSACRRPPGGEIRFALCRLARSSSQRQPRRASPRRGPGSTEGCPKGIRHPSGGPETSVGRGGAPHMHRSLHARRGIELCELCSRALHRKC